jgi:hypothetical protein
MDIKRKIVIDSNDKIFYDFSVESNNQTNNDSFIYNCEPIHVEQEYHLSKLIQTLHNNYEQKFKSLFHTFYAPKDSLNRFLYEQLSLSNRKRENLIVTPENILKMDTLDKEIRSAYPMTCRFKSDTPKWKLDKNLKDCIYLSKKISKKFVQNKELKKLLTNQDSYEIFFDKFQNVRNDFCSHFLDEINENIKNIKYYLFEEIKRNKLDKKISNLNRNESVKNLVNIDSNRDQAFVYVSYRDTEFKLKQLHFKKLQILYQKNEHKFNKSVKFEERLLK